tara:strand:+ start:40 stop:804 length:765 start_codon:yes stop_codon:yes gene_type:complete
MSAITSIKKLKENNFFIFIPISNRLEPIKINLNITLDDLLEINHQKEIVLKNTKNFLENKSSNNILLWGAKGMGKSSLVKCVVNYYNKEFNKDLKMLEVFNNNIENLTNIVYQLSKCKHKFIIFIDDISFKDNDNNFSLFKTLVEGSLLSHTENVRYYITSNLRHLSHRNSDSPNNDIENKENNQNLISLSDRFGCWVGFYDSNQEQYINMVKYYLKKNSITFSEEVKKKALSWSIQKGNFSGRTAQQFVNNLK